MKLVKLAALAPLAVLAACADSTTGNLGFSVTTRSAASVAAVSAALAPGAPMPSVTAAGDSTVIALSPDTIIVRSAELVLSKVELKRSDAASCDSITGNGDCEEFETGATLVTLPLGSTAITQDVAINAPAGTFDGLEFEIHKPSGDDTAFIAANPDFANVSIRVTGTYIHGTGSGAGTRSDFVFTSDVDQGQEQILNPPVTVGAGQAVNVTLRVDIATWFLNDTQTALVDPASANKGNANESIVANNIQNSFKAFEDDNRDGLDN